MKSSEPSFLKQPAQPAFRQPARPSFRAAPVIDLVALRKPPVLAALLAAIIGMGLGGYSLYTIKPATTVRLPVPSATSPGEPATSARTAEKPERDGKTRALGSANGAAAKAPKRTAAPDAAVTSAPSTAASSARTGSTAPPRPAPASTAPGAAAGSSGPPQISEEINVDASIYSRRDRDVTPPIPILPQSLGALPPGVRLQDKMMIEIVLDEEGSVESAKTVDPPQTLGDAVVVTMALSAVKSWHFRPALKDGHPVKYRQQIPVTLR